MSEAIVDGLSEKERAYLEHVRQAQALLGLNRTGVYYTPRPVSQADLQLMRRIDELHLKHPYYGARRLAKQLRAPAHNGRGNLTICIVTKVPPCASVLLSDSRSARS